MRLRLTLAALALCAAAAAPAQANDARITAERQVTSRVVELTISTPAFAAPTKVHVDLPVGYDADPAKRWPVTYALAGTMNRYTAFNNVLGGEKLSAGYPSIIVAPDANSGYWSDWFNGGGFGPPKYETFVIDQLIPLIDEHYRTNPDRSQRVVFGISMGGYGSEMFAARHPDLFVASATLSGAVDSNLAPLAAVLSASSTFDNGPVDAINGPRSTQEVRWHGRNPWDLADNLRDMDLQVRTANGNPNPAIGENPAGADGVSCVVEQGVHLASVSLHERLDALKVGHVWKDYGDGCHTPPNFKRQTIDTLSAFQRVLANPPAAPATFDYRSIEPRFGVYGWTVEADPARALEFLQLTDAGSDGATFTGSGTTTVTSPADFTGLREVDVISEGATGTLAPDGDGRVRFTVDLGRAHPDQQYTDASRAAGEGGAGYFTTRAVRFEPHSRLLLTRVRRTRTGARACLRAAGPAVRGVRLALTGRRGRRVARLRRLDAGESARCVRFAVRRRNRSRRYLLRATGTDRFGHPVAESARAR